MNIGGSGSFGLSYGLGAEPLNCRNGGADPGLPKPLSALKSCGISSGSWPRAWGSGGWFSGGFSC